MEGAETAILKAPQMVTFSILKTSEKDTFLLDRAGDSSVVSPHLFTL